MFSAFLSISHVAQGDATAVAAASTTAGVLAKPSNFAEAAAAAVAKREREHAAAAAEAAALVKEQERAAAEEVAAAAAAAATAAAADSDAVVQATSDFLGGNPVLCQCVANFCKVAGAAPLDALRALRAVVVAGANAGSAVSQLPPSLAVLSVLLPHCDNLFPSSSLAFIMMCHMVPSSTPSPATPAAPVASSGATGVPAAVLQLALCRHTNTDALPSFPATLALMLSIGLLTKCADGSLSVPPLLVSAGLGMSSASSSPSSSSTMIMSISSALRETFATATASASVITRTPYFHQLSYVALNSDCTSADAAAAAAAALLPLLEMSMSQLGGGAVAGPQDERLSALAGVTECVGAAYGFMSLSSTSLPALPLSSSSPSHYLDLQISTLQSCIDMKEQALGPQHFDTARTLVSLAVALLHRAAAAAAADSAADAAYTAANSPAHLDSLSACSLLQRALGIQESTLGVSHVEVTGFLAELLRANERTRP
jgi:hypothetical protein